MKKIQIFDKIIDMVYDSEEFKKQKIHDLYKLFLRIANIFWWQVIYKKWYIIWVYIAWMIFHFLLIKESPSWEEKAQMFLMPLKTKNLKKIFDYDRTELRISSFDRERFQKM